MASFKDELSKKEAQLLADVKNYLDISFDDEEYDKNLYNHLCNGKKMLDDLCGREQNYSQKGTERSLLFDYCRYAVNKNLEYFKKNFREELIGLVIEKEAEKYAGTN